MIQACFPTSDSRFVFYSTAGDAPDSAERLEIMVDGSGDGHSVALFPGDEVFFMYEKGASNNEAEFNAIILALENLPAGSHARVRTDSQTVVWHLTSGTRSKPTSFVKKAVQIQELIVNRELTIEIQWIPRKLNTADRLLKQYVASLCGAGGREPMYQKIRRLEAENNRLKARLRNVMRMLKTRPEGCPDPCVAMDVLEM